MSLKLKKNARRVLLIALLSWMISCSDDFLRVEPNSGLTDYVLATPEGLERLLIGAYAMLDGFAGWEVGSPWESAMSNWLFGDVCADDAYRGSDAGDSGPLNLLEIYQARPDLQALLTKWTALYEGVARANHVLRVLPLALEKETIDAPLALQLEAEAKFLRAFYHFELIKVFENVPFVDEIQTYQPLANPGAPWDRVIADFHFAAAKLPVNHRNSQLGRVTKYAATAFLGKALLYQTRFNEALNAFNEVITADHYSLAPNFHDNFRTSGDNNVESVFQYQASVNDDPEGSNGNIGDILNFPYLGGPGRCCGFYQPSQNLVNAFQTRNGLPLPDSFNAADIKSDEGLLSDQPFEPHTGPLDPRLDWTVGRRGIPYLDWGNHPGRNWIRDQDYGGPYSPIKHVYYKAEEGINSQATGWATSLSGNNYNIMRYADVLLMAAECEVEAGDLEKARAFVNQVRNRAANPAYFVKRPDGAPAANYVIAPYSEPWTDRAFARKAVRFERRLELAMEGHRLFDLARWGVAKQVINEYLAKESIRRFYLRNVVFNDHNVRQPIPAREIERSQGLLRQNPGY